MTPPIAKATQARWPARSTVTPRTLKMPPPTAIAMASRRPSLPPVRTARWVRGWNCLGSVPATSEGRATVAAASAGPAGEGDALDVADLEAGSARAEGDRAARDAAGRAPDPGGELDHVGPRASVDPLQPDVPVASPDQEDIVARAAALEVAPGAAPDHVVAGAAPDRVVAGAGPDVGGPPTAAEAIAPGGAQEIDAALLDRQRVAAARPVAGHLEIEQAGRAEAAAEHRLPIAAGADPREPPAGGHVVGLEPDRPPRERARGDRQQAPRGGAKRVGVAVRTRSGGARDAHAGRDRSAVPCAVRVVERGDPAGADQGDEGVLGLGRVDGAEHAPGLEDGLDEILSL